MTPLDAMRSAIDELTDLLNLNAVVTHTDIREIIGKAESAIGQLERESALQQLTGVQVTRAITNLRTAIAELDERGNQIVHDDQDEPCECDNSDPFCTCSAGHSIEEQDWNQCDSCGKPIYDDYLCSLIQCCNQAN